MLDFIYSHVIEACQSKLSILTSSNRPYSSETYSTKLNEETHVAGNKSESKSLILTYQGERQRTPTNIVK
jgi:hypothetical protein